MAPVKSSLPFLTCSGLPPAVMMVMVPASIMTRAIAPTIPAEKVRRMLPRPPLAS